MTERRHELYLDPENGTAEGDGSKEHPFKTSTQLNAYLDADKGSLKPNGLTINILNDVPIEEPIVLHPRISSYIGRKRPVIPEAERLRLLEAQWATEAAQDKLRRDRTAKEFRGKKIKRAYWEEEDRCWILNFSDGSEVAVRLMADLHRDGEV